MRWRCGIRRRTLRISVSPSSQTHTNNVWIPVPYLLAFEEISSPHCCWTTDEKVRRDLRLILDALALYCCLVRLVARQQTSPVSLSKRRLRVENGSGHFFVSKLSRLPLPAIFYFCIHNASATATREFHATCLGRHECCRSDEYSR